MTDTTTSDAPIVFVDCETNGVHPGRQAWEVAMIRRDHEGERRMEFFIDVDLSDADPFGLGVGKFYERHPKGRLLSGAVAPSSPDANREVKALRTPMEAAFEIARWTHGAHLIGSNPGFDAYTFDPLLRAHGLIPAWNYHVVDVAAMALGYLNHAAKNLEARAVVEKNGDLRAEAARFRQAATPPYSTDELSGLLGLPPVPRELRHTAMGDAAWALAMWDRMTGRTA